ncbi:MAG: branched-chain amino acid ABC transporter permease [Chloroflexi bacterium]|nr:branched-chain amino acid ABC transporter permease [Chloroflexota bacterium]
MTLQLFLLQILNGLTFAALLFMLASGFTLIFGLMRIMNLTHGGLYMIGGYLGFTVLLVTGNFLLALLVAGALIAVMGVGIDRVFLGRLRGQVMAEVLLTIGLAFIMGDVSLAIWGGDPRNIRPPGWLESSVQIGNLTAFPVLRLLVLITGIVIALCLWYMMERTRLGAVIRAGVDDREMVDSLGINIRLVFTLLFAFGAFLAGFTGVLGGAYLSLYPGVDFEILLYALVVVIIGGPGSLLGAVIGSVAVGLINAFAIVLVPELVYFTIFAPMALILVWRPYGLFGRPL